MSAKKGQKDEGPVPQSTAAAFSSLAIYSIAMVLTPLVLFMLSAEKFFDPIYAVTIGVPSPDKRAVVSGIVAVIGVNLVVFSFVRSAFRDEDAKPKQD